MWAVETKTPLSSTYTHVWMQQADMSSSAVSDLNLTSCFISLHLRLETLCQISPCHTSMFL